MKYRANEYSDNPNLFPVGSLVLFFDGRSRSKLHPPWTGLYIVLEHFKGATDRQPIQYQIHCRQTGKEITAQGGQLWPITIEEAAKYDTLRAEIAPGNKHKLGLVSTLDKHGKGTQCYKEITPVQYCIAVHSKNS